MNIDSGREEPDTFREANRRSKEDLQLLLSQYKCRLEELLGEDSELGRLILTRWQTYLGTIDYSYDAGILVEVIRAPYGMWSADQQMISHRITQFSRRNGYAGRVPVRVWNELMLASMSGIVLDDEHTRIIHRAILRVPALVDQLNAELSKGGGGMRRYMLRWDGRQRLMFVPIRVTPTDMSVGSPDNRLVSLSLMEALFVETANHFLLFR